ncbi:MAG: hypothetical protein MSA89_02175 [Clostridium sp.]|nr:hypothetical protein [Clostridium sp.]
MKKVKYIGMIFFLCFALISSFVCIPYVNIMADEDQDLGGEEFWCPVNGKDYEFTVNNTWNEEGYIDYIEFDDSYIKNTSLGENYTLEEAMDNGIISKYNVKITMDDKKYGKADIFSGKLSELKGLKLKVTNVYLKLNTYVSFKMSISIEGGEIPNEDGIIERYTYIFNPKVYKSSLSKEEYENENKNTTNKESFQDKEIIRTEDPIYTQAVILAVVLVISMEAMVILIRKYYIEERG